MGKCDGKHCDDLSKLGPYDVQNMQFKTENPDRKDCLECTSSCGCDPKLCQNRSIQKGKRLVINKHLKEQLTFGIDQSTRRRISKLFQKECGFGNTEINKFIEEILQPSFNAFLMDCEKFPELKSSKIIYKNQDLNPDTAPFFMTDVLRAIKHKHKDTKSKSYLDINEDDIEMTETLLNKIVKTANMRNIDSKHSKYVLDIGGGLEGEYCEEFYPIYPKGNGVICTIEDGIDINQFVIEYFGEVYPAWRWYEKCDLQKQVTRALTDAPELPDFFNIMLERHENDPDGYDLLFIDPIKKGNFGSRFSHSCSPNTQTVPIAVNGKYVIGIFAQKKIKYGQELTFDYNSVTESEQEYRSAICLCSQLKCRGTYLSYAGSNTYQQILGLYHNNLHRAAIIFKSCCDLSDEPIDKQKEMREIETKLKERHISNSMLSGLPAWGKKFAYLITNFIEFESKELPKELTEKYAGLSHITEQDIKDEVYGVKEQRKQNIAVTMDKIKYVLRNQSKPSKKSQPPLRRLSDKEILYRLWNDDNSLVKVLLRCIRYHVPKGNEGINKESINEIESFIIKQGRYLMDYKLLKTNLMIVRDKLRDCVNTDSCYFSAAADLIHLWANTKWFFTHNTYDSIKSSPFTLEELGFTDENCMNKNINTSIKCQKPYGPLYIWGQMTFWWKQTVEKPDTSLSHCRRGCIYLPFIDCCFAKKLKHPIVKPYDNKTRNYFIESLSDNPQNPWSTSLHWTFKGGSSHGSGNNNNGKTYGSPFLDHYLDENTDLMKIINELKEWNYGD